MKGRVNLALVGSAMSVVRQGEKVSAMNARADLMTVLPVPVATILPDHAQISHRASLQAESPCLQNLVTVAKCLCLGMFKSERPALSVNPWVAP
jgi:hypothetical protein